MKPLRLSINQPCPQDWNSMTGGNEFRHCATCSKEVVALAEMDPEDAADLIRRSKPHSLCLRIEHDDAGAVIFRKSHSTSNSKPLLMLTMGASLLVNACENAPSANPTATPEKSPPTQSIDQEKPLSTHSAPEVDPAPVIVVPASNAKNTPASSAGSLQVKPHGGASTRITTGCVCAPGDKLCDCL